MSTRLWDPYYLAQDTEIAVFWSRLRTNGEGRLLYLLGRGFDPRAVTGAEILASANYSGKCDFVAINMVGPEATGARSLRPMADAHFARLQRFAYPGLVEEVEVHTQSGVLGAAERTGPDQAFRLIAKSDLRGYTDVVLDISALPRGLYFPLLARLIDLCTTSGTEPLPSLHVFVAEAPSVDDLIEEQALEEDAYFSPPFRSSMELDSNVPIIWMPMLGERQETQVSLVQTLVGRYAEDIEVCPVLPFPARDPRRADNLIREYHEFLASGWENDARNFVYVCEHNPFQAYRHIHNTAHQYHSALGPLGECRIVLSAHSSKLLSLGCLLAAYALKREHLAIGLANVDATSYRISSMKQERPAMEAVVPHLLSLTGEVYAS